METSQLHALDEAAAMVGSLRASIHKAMVGQSAVIEQVLIADEINRAPAKTQSALLEVMQEYQVTLEGHALPVPKPFMVLATQNPVETEGTYPLPEAQLDRFLFKIEIGYPSSAEEVDVVVRATDAQAGNELPLSQVTPCLDAAAVTKLQELAAQQRVDAQGVEYAVRDGRDYVTPDDIKRIALPALRHRVALAPDALLEGRRTNDLLAGVIETVAAPRV